MKCSNWDCGESDRVGDKAIKTGGYCNVDCLQHWRSLGYSNGRCCKKIDPRNTKKVEAGSNSYMNGHWVYNNVGK